MVKANANAAAAAASGPGVYSAVYSGVSLFSCCDFFYVTLLVHSSEHLRLKTECHEQQMSLMELAPDTTIPH
jgi:hypothetical protein